VTKIVTKTGLKNEKSGVHRPILLDFTGAGDGTRTRKPADYKAGALPPPVENAIATVIMVNKKYSYVKAFRVLKEIE